MLPISRAVPPWCQSSEMLPAFFRLWCPSQTIDVMCLLPACRSLCPSQSCTPRQRCCPRCVGHHGSIDKCLSGDVWQPSQCAFIMPPVVCFQLLYTVYMYVQQYTCISTHNTRSCKCHASVMHAHAQSRTRAHTDAHILTHTCTY